MPQFFGWLPDGRTGTHRQAKDFRTYVCGGFSKWVMVVSWLGWFGSTPNDLIKLHQHGKELGSWTLTSFAAAILSSMNMRPYAIHVLRYRSGKAWCMNCLPAVTSVAPEPAFFDPAAAPLLSLLLRFLHGGQDLGSKVGGGWSLRTSWHRSQRSKILSSSHSSLLADKRRWRLVVGRLNHHEGVPRKLKTVPIPAHRRAQPDSQLTEPERRQLRALLGSIQWLVAQLRFDMGHMLPHFKGKLLWWRLCRRRPIFWSNSSSSTLTLPWRSSRLTWKMQVSRLWQMPHWAMWQNWVEQKEAWWRRSTARAHTLFCWRIGTSSPAKTGLSRWSMPEAIDCRGSADPHTLQSCKELKKLQTLSFSAVDSLPTSCAILWISAVPCMRSVRSHEL